MSDKILPRLQLGWNPHTIQLMIRRDKHIRSPRSIFILACMVNLEPYLATIKSINDSTLDQKVSMGDDYALVFRVPLPNIHTIRCSGEIGQDRTSMAIRPVSPIELDDIACSNGSDERRWSATGLAVGSPPIALKAAQKQKSSRLVYRLRKDEVHQTR